MNSRLVMSKPLWITNEKRCAPSSIWSTCTLATSRRRSCSRLCFATTTLKAGARKFLRSRSICSMVSVIAISMAAAGSPAPAAAPSDWRCHWRRRVQLRVDVEQPRDLLRLVADVGRAHPRIGVEEQLHRQHVGVAVDEGENRVRQARQRRARELVAFLERVLGGVEKHFRLLA